MADTLFSQSGGGTVAADTASYTLGVLFQVSTDTSLAAIWFYSASGAAALPATIAVFLQSSAALVSSQAATWSGAAGSGWVRAAFASPPSLTAATYYTAAVFYGGGANWYSATAHYWDTGAGASGITSGVLTAPNNATAAGLSHVTGQDGLDSSGVLAFPGGAFNAANYWADPEVGTGGVPAALASSSAAANASSNAISLGMTIRGS